jgi:tetratricopeptide (TPR) repeat protein
LVNKKTFKDVRRLVLFVFVFSLIGSLNILNAQESPSAASLYNDGMALMKEKNYKEGYPLLKEAIAKADSTTETGQKVTRLAKKNGAIAAYYVGNDQRKSKAYEEAIETYSSGVSYNPGFYANYIGLAQALEGKGDVGEAIDAYLNAGEACEKANKADKAEKMNKKAENLVAISWGAKNWKEVETYATAFLDKKESTDVEYYLAYAMKESGQHEKALEHIEKVIVASGDAVDDKCLMVKAETFEKMGNKEEAIAVYKQIKGSKYGERAAYKVKTLGGTN